MSKLDVPFCSAVIRGALVWLAMALGWARVQAAESPNGDTLSLAARMVQASSRSGGVMLSSLSDHYWSIRFEGARRVMTVGQ